MPSKRCAVCPMEGVEVTVAGRTLFLCGSHRRRLHQCRAEDLEDLAALFAVLRAERRTPGERRQEERRMFPPRPELRRHGVGRRAGDPD